MRWLIIGLLISTACIQAKNTQVFKSVNYEQWKSALDATDESLVVVNYWATWCRPCLEELPDFMEVNKAYASDSFKMILVSLDFAEELNEKVLRAKERLELDTDIYVLDDPTRMDEWINAVDPEWSGAIPATVIYKDKKAVAFHEGKLNKTELETLLNKYI